MNSQRQTLIALIRLFIVAVFGLLLTGCGGLITLVTATPNETQQTAVAIASAPADNPADTASATVAATVTRRPRNTATATPVDSTNTPTPKASKPTAKPARTATAIPSTVDGLKTIAPDDLPAEAQQTLALIDSGGPFPYSRDGIVFQNREGILPKKSSTYYHEYTVVTPGSPDRGAKRLIAGSKGEIYYTEDHYITFVRVIR